MQNVKLSVQPRTASHQRYFQITNKFDSPNKIQFEQRFKSQTPGRPRQIRYFQSFNDKTHKDNIQVGLKSKTPVKIPVKPSQYTYKFSSRSKNKYASQTKISEVNQEQTKGNTIVNNPKQSINTEPSLGIKATNHQDQTEVASKSHTRMLTRKPMNESTSLLKQRLQKAEKLAFIKQQEWLKQKSCLEYTINQQQKRIQNATQIIQNQNKRICVLQQKIQAAGSSNSGQKRCHPSLEKQYQCIIFNIAQLFSAMKQMHQKQKIDIRTLTMRNSLSDVIICDQQERNEQLVGELNQLRKENLLKSLPQKFDNLLEKRYKESVQLIQLVESNNNLREQYVQLYANIQRITDQSRLQPFQHLEQQTFKP